MTGARYHGPFGRIKDLNRTVRSALPLAVLAAARASAQQVTFAPPGVSLRARLPETGSVTERLWVREAGRLNLQPSPGRYWDAMSMAKIR